MRSLTLISVLVVTAAPLFSAEPPALPSPEDQARLAADPLFQSFTEAFDEVLTETAPELRSGRPEETGRAGSDSPFLVPQSPSALSEMFERALPPALACARLPGAKAPRPFLFARNTAGEYFCLETGGDFDMSVGEILFTGRPLDAALGEDGGVFFRLKKEGDETLFYSRAGNFTAGPDGALCLERGGERFYLEPHSADLGSTACLVRFSNPAFLTSDDAVFFRPTEKSGEPLPADVSGSEKTRIRTGYLENSNARPDLILRFWKESAGSLLAGEKKER